MLEKIFGSKRDEIRGILRQLHEELHNLYSSPNVTSMINAGRMLWAGNVAGVGGSLKAKYH
jgi:hypothetical protein